MSFLVRLPESQYATDALSGVDTGEFSFANARAAAWASQLSYEDYYEKITRIATTWGAISCCRLEAKLDFPLPVSSTQVIILEAPRFAVLAFAGTDPLDLADWITDFNFHPNGRGIHSGFGRAVGTIWQDAAARVMTNDRPLIIAGHSLGGALAVLFAHRLVQERRKRLVGVYTFGMPRCCGHAFAHDISQSIGDRTFRFIHGTDIVPTMPPSMFGFSHVGIRVQCERHGKFAPSDIALEPDDEPQSSISGRSLREILRQIRTIELRSPEIRTDPIGRLSFLLPLPIADHLPDRYWKALSPDY
jgi:hypothetical protein